MVYTSLFWMDSRWSLVDSTAMPINESFPETILNLQIGPTAQTVASRPSWLPALESWLRFAVIVGVSASEWIDLLERVVDGQDLVGACQRWDSTWKALCRRTVWLHFSVGLLATMKNHPLVQPSHLHLYVFDVWKRLKFPVCSWSWNRSPSAFWLFVDCHLRW